MSALVPSPGTRPWPRSGLVAAAAGVLAALTLAGFGSGVRGASVVATGVGFATGLAIRLGRPWAILLAVVDGAVVAAVGLPFGRSPALALISGAVSGAIIALGWRVAAAAGLRTLARPRDVLLLGLVAATCGALVAVVVVTERALGLLPAGIDDWATVRSISLAMALGILVAAPLALAFPEGRARISSRRLAEALVLAALTVVLLAVTLVPEPGELLQRSGGIFLTLPVLGWVAIRFGPGLLAAFLCVTAAAVGASVSRGRGMFSDGDVSTDQTVLGAQVFLLVASVGALLLAVYAEHLRAKDSHEQALGQLLDQAIEGSGAGLFVKTVDAATGRLVYRQVNDVFAADLGTTPAAILGRSDDELVEASAGDYFRAQDDLVLRTGVQARFDGSVRVKGRPFRYSTLMFPIRSGEDEVVGVGGVRFDRTAEHRRESLLELVFARSPIPTARLAWTGEAAGTVLEANGAFGQLLGEPLDQIVGQDLGRFQAPMPGQRQRELLGLGATAARHEVALVRSDGVPLRAFASAMLVNADVPDDSFVLLILEDVTARRAAEAGLQYRASYDAITDLLNRHALLERLAERLAELPAGGSLAVLCADVDGFKHLNDSLGHEAGDRVLREVARRLGGGLRDDDLIARLGGDEFVVVRSDVGGTEAALALGQQVRALLTSPVDVGGASYGITLSVGVTVTGPIIPTPEELLRQADVAMSRAKDAGRNRCVPYSPDLDRRAHDRLSVQESVRLALAEDRILVHLQPVLALASGRVVAAEALVRMRDPAGALVPPGAFIDVAEQSGLIIPVGDRVLARALDLAAAWPSAGLRIGIAVNVSPRQVTSPGFADNVTAQLLRAGLDPDLLTLEITESAVVDADGRTRDVLAHLRGQGVHVAIDDFGTGFSSMTSLRHLPADVVKIDRSFVSGLGRDSDDEAIVRAVTSVAHDTGRLVVGEGVETEEQARFLAGIGCDMVQGFLFARPGDPDAMDLRAVYPAFVHPARIGDARAPAVPDGPARPIVARSAGRDVP